VQDRESTIRRLFTPAKLIRQGQSRQRARISENDAYLLSLRSVRCSPGWSHSPPAPRLENFAIVVGVVRLSSFRWLRPRIELDGTRRAECLIAALTGAAFALPSVCSTPPSAVPRTTAPGPDDQTRLLSGRACPLRPPRSCPEDGVELGRAFQTTLSGAWSTHSFPSRDTRRSAPVLRDGFFDQFRPRTESVTIRRPRRIRKSPRVPRPCSAMRFPVQTPVVGRTPTSFRAWYRRDVSSPPRRSPISCPLVTSRVVGALGDQGALAYLPPPFLAIVGRPDVVFYTAPRPTPEYRLPCRQGPTGVPWNSTAPRRVSRAPIAWFRHHHAHLHGARRSSTTIQTSFCWGRCVPGAGPLYQPPRKATSGSVEYDLLSAVAVFFQ